MVSYYTDVTLNAVVCAVFFDPDQFEFLSDSCKKEGDLSFFYSGDALITYSFAAESCGMEVNKIPPIIAIAIFAIDVLMAISVRLAR